MNVSRRKKLMSLSEKYPPSESCGCMVCLGYCRRPGWWTVEQAEKAFSAGYAYRMMLEISPELTFGVLSPAFRGNEGKAAMNVFSQNGCCFLKNNLCELYETGLMPLECSFCHHDRIGEGRICHLDLEKDWNTAAGQVLVKKWINAMQLHAWRRMGKAE